MGRFRRLNPQFYYFLLIAGVAVLLIFLPLLKDPDNRISLIWTTILGLITMGIAVFIANMQTQIVVQIRDLLFGTMVGFDPVYHRVVELIEWANGNKQTKLALMVYWLWFGADEALVQDPGRKFGEIKANDSKVRKLISNRMQEGLETLIVTYDPEKAEQQLKRFLLSVCKWQRKKHRGNGVEPTDEELQDVIISYKQDFEYLNGTERKNIAGSKFEEFVARDDIPMLIFAAIDQNRHESKGLVYLGGIDALETESPTGGFYTEDRKLVEIIYEQIKCYARNTE